MPPTPTAVIFDLGNVLIDVDFQRCLSILSRRSGVPESDLLNRFSIGAPYEMFERGEIDASAYFDSLRDILGIDLTDRQFAEGWNAVIRGERPGARKAVALARKLGPVFLLTNTNALHASVWLDQHKDLLEDFEKLFVSSEMGCRKPEREIYDRTVRHIGHPPHRILFLDDSAENVRGAMQYGIQAEQVTSPESLILAIEAYHQPRRDS